MTGTSGTIGTTVNSTGTSTATCPATKVLLGGGYTLSNTTSSNYRDITVIVNRATTAGVAGVWTATGVNNNGGTSSNTTIVAYVVCTP